MKTFKQYLEEKQEKSVSKWLLPLANEAKHYDSFEEYSKAYSLDAIRGIYYHFTENENFEIDPELGPRDFSSMSFGKMTDKNAIMVTSEFSHWYDNYKNNRKYVALLDCSDIKKSQVGRGFGNEFYIKDSSKCKLIKVMTLKQAKDFVRKFDKLIPHSNEELLYLYNLNRK